MQSPLWILRFSLLFMYVQQSMIYASCWFWSCRSQIARHRDKLLNYMLFLRVTPTLPNLFINLASPIVDIPFYIFFLATVIGIIPASYITVRVSSSTLFLSIFIIPICFQFTMAVGIRKRKILDAVVNVWWAVARKTSRVCLMLASHSKYVLIMHHSLELLHFNPFLVLDD